MKITIEADAKEVADLVAALQGRLDVGFNPACLAEAIRSATESGEAVHLRGDEVGHSFLKSE